MRMKTTYKLELAYTVENVLYRISLLNVFSHDFLEYSIEEF